VYAPQSSATPGESSFTPDLARCFLTVLSHRLSLSGFRSSPSPLSIGGLGSLGGGNLAGPGSAMVPVGGSGAGGVGSGRSGCSLTLLDLEGLSGMSGMNVPGSSWSLCSREGTLVGV